MKRFGIWTWLKFVVVYLAVVFGLTGLILLFVPPAHGHDLHLGDLQTQSEIYLMPCYDGTYIAASKETGCFLIYRDGGLVHAPSLHYTHVPRESDGSCRCPEKETDNHGRINH